MRHVQLSSLAISIVSSFALLTGCSSGSGANPGATGTGGTGGAGVAVGTLSGNVVVELVSDQNYATVTAQIFDGPKPLANPSVGPLSISQTIGGCQLLVPTVASCSPACVAPEVCGDNGHCAAIPTSQNVGVLHIEGLAGMELALDPVAPAFAYAGPTLPDPPCAEGADVKVQSDRFALTGKCIAALKLSGPDPIPVKSGQVVHFTWAAPGKTGISRIQIALEISHHGGYKGEIDCDVPDTGMFDIPAPLVTDLVKLGVAGYPTVFVSRISEAPAPTQTGVKLTLLSSTVRNVDTGVVSCGMGTSTCPTGTTCDNATKTCK